MNAAKDAFDPVSLEIFWSRLISIADEFCRGVAAHLLLHDRSRIK